jgi:gliding motility-associated-like protein
MKIYKYLFLLGYSALVGGSSIHAQVPGGVYGNLKMWLKANEGVTVSPANTVTNWAEQSGSGVLGDFSTQGAAINKPSHQPPTFLPAGINFNPYIVFNATATPNSVSSANAVTGAQILDPVNNTLFQVIRLKTMTSTGVWLKWQWQTNPYGGARLGCEVNNPGLSAGRIRMDFRGSNVGPTVVADKHALSTGVMGGQSTTLRLNGATDNILNVTATFSPGTTTGRLTLGAEPYGDDYPTKIDIAEEILYSRTLTPLERNQVESYLAVKYGFTLMQTGPDANDYTASNGTVIWNHVANAPYYNNITGVGRDDSSGLHQKQSLSINNRAMVTMYSGNVPGVFPALNVDNNNVFANDRSYVLFGDNLADTLVTLCGPDGRFARMQRTWKVQVTGNPGVVTLALQKANVPPAIKALIVASDPNFTTNVVQIPMQDNGTQLYAAHNFTSNQYFTFGSMPVQLNGVVGPVVCEGNNGSVTLNPTDGISPISYQWNSTPPQTGQNLSGVSPGVYTVTVTHGNGCTFSETFTIPGSATPVYARVVDTQNTLCTSDNGVIKVDGTGGTPFYQFSLDGSSFSTNKTYTGLAAGAHIIRIRDQNECEHDTTVVLTNHSYELDVTAETGDAWCDAGGLGGYMRVSVEGGTGPYGYFWDELRTGKGPVMQNLPKGRYKVIVTDRYGCTGEVIEELDENYCCTIWIPNAFTPNNDGNNDVFKAIPNRSIPRFEMSIFNRWGQRVFNTVRDNEGWDGNNESGKPVDAGVYFYKIRYTCERGDKEFNYSGDLTLVR